MKIKLEFQMSQNIDPEEQIRGWVEDNLPEDVFVDESSYRLVDSETLDIIVSPKFADVIEITFRVVADYEKDEGRFVSRDDLTISVLDEFDTSAELEGLGEWELEVAEG